MKNSRGEVFQSFVSGSPIFYRIVFSIRAKRIRIAVNHEGECCITAPTRTPQYIINEIVSKRGSWIIEKRNYFLTIKQKSPKYHLTKGTREEYVLHKERARVLVESKLEYFNQFYNLTWSRVSIKDTSSRWGSCSKLGNLNFSYKMALLPESLLDYIVVHEMCHLLEMNHSLLFWSHVAKTIPDYKARRQELKKYV